MIWIVYALYWSAIKRQLPEIYGFPEEQAREAIQVYREYFSVKGWRENKVFPCIPEMLGELKAAGKKLYLATSKPEVFAKQILGILVLLLVLNLLVVRTWKRPVCVKGT